MPKVSCDFHLSMGVSRKANYSILILVARPNPKLRIAVTPRHEIAVTPRHEQVSRGCKSCRGLVPSSAGFALGDLNATSSMGDALDLAHLRGSPFGGLSRRLRCLAKSTMHRLRPRRPPRRLPPAPPVERAMDRINEQRGRLGTHALFLVAVRHLRQVPRPAHPMATPQHSTKPRHSSWRAKHVRA